MWIAAVGCLLALTNAFANGQYGDSDSRSDSSELTDNIAPLPIDNVANLDPVPIPSGSNPYGQIKPKPDTPSYGQIKPSPDTPSYGQIKPSPDTPSYGQIKPKPDTPSYGQIKPKPDTPSYGQIKPSPDTPSYGQIKPKPDTPSPYGQIRPKPDTPSPYGQKPKPDPQPSPYNGNKPAYGGNKKPVTTPLETVTPFFEGDDILTHAPSTECQHGDTWMDVMGCYECELRKSAASCKSQLPPSFDFCYNKTALFRMSSLFSDCLSTKEPTCHKLTENMAFAFLLANYDDNDGDIIDLNRRNECLFQRARTPLMQCMSQCDDLQKIKNTLEDEPVVVCYNELHVQIDAMLHDFSSCIKTTVIMNN